MGLNNLTLQSAQMAENSDSTTSVPPLTKVVIYNQHIVRNQLELQMEFAVQMTCQRCVDDIKRKLDGVPGLLS